MGMFGKLKKDIGGGLDVLSAVYSHPITTTKVIAKLPFQKEKSSQQLRAVVKKTKKEGAKKTILRTIRTTAVASAVVVGGGTSAGRTFVAKTLIPKTPKGLLKIPLAVTGLTVLATSRKARKSVDVATDPTTWVKGGEIIGETIETGKPPLSPKEALLTGGLLAGGVVGAVAVTKGLDSLPSIIPEKPVGQSNQIPLTPATATITTGKKKYKRRKAKKTPSVRQSVKINIINKPRNTGFRITNKRYLNKELLC